MKKYLAFFRLRFSMGLQYRAAALAGMATQFVWGAMEILMFRAFYLADKNAFPMTFHATASYVWMQQAFLALFMVWMMENDIFDAITDGNIAYELCRPVDIYPMWFARSLASRFSRAVLRCMPHRRIGRKGAGHPGYSLYYRNKPCTALLWARLQPS